MLVSGIAARVSASLKFHISTSEESWRLKKHLKMTANITLGGGRSRTQSHQKNHICAIISKNKCFRLFISKVNVAIANILLYRKSFYNLPELKSKNRGRQVTLKGGVAKHLWTIKCKTEINFISLHHHSNERCSC